PGILSGPTSGCSNRHRRADSDNVINLQLLAAANPWNDCNRHEAPTADNRLADQIASLRPFATRNATFFDALLALILISSPVAGLRPLRAGRAGRTRTCRTPRLGMRILLPFFSTRPMSATKPVN